MQGSYGLGSGVGENYLKSRNHPCSCLFLCLCHLPLARRKKLSKCTPFCKHWDAHTEGNHLKTTQYTRQLSILFACMQPSNAGLLAAPPGLTATVLNSSTVRLTWSPPFTLNVSGAQPSITGYSIVVEDIYTDQEVVLARNSSLSEYYHHSSDCQFYQVTVAGLNGVGMGQWSQPVTYSLGGK